MDFPGLFIFSFPVHFFFCQLALLSHQQWKEMIESPGQRIGRPQQLYQGLSEFLSVALFQLHGLLFAFLGKQIRSVEPIEKRHEPLTERTTKSLMKRTNSSLLLAEPA